MIILRIAAAGFVLLAAAPAYAANAKQVIEGCRNSIGKPIVMACMRGGGGSLEACREKARPKVQACVQAALEKSLPKVATPKAETPSAEDMAKAAPTSLVAPPRTVSDITAILDQQKPDPARTEQLQVAADAAVSDNLKGPQLADFYYKRAQARAQLGRNEEAVADAELAVSNGKGADYLNALSRYEQFLGRRLRDVGQYKRADEIFSKQMATFATKGKGRLFGLNQGYVAAAIRNGDINKAEAYAARNRTLLAEAKRWPNFPIYGANWQASVEEGDARVAELRGLYADAEANYRKASQSYMNTLKYVAQWESKPPEGELERAADWMLALQGRVKVKQGRVGEGEADVRRALLSRLSKSGKFHVDTAGILSVLVYVVQEQGRYKDAELLQREVIEIYQGLRYPAESGPMVNAQLFLAQILNLQRRYDDAGKLYDQIDVWTAKWEPSRRETVSGGLARVSTLLTQGSTANALEIAQRSLERERSRSGDKSFNTAVARGYYAVALARNSKPADALQAFRESIPVLLNTSAGSDDDSGATAAASEGRVRFVLEGYLRVLALNPALAPANVADETFGYADVLRGQAVQRALQASSARSATDNPELANLIRTSQDGEKKIGAAVASLNNLLSSPPSERDKRR